MSTVAHGDAAKADVNGVRKFVSRVRVTMPAPKSYRDALLADFRHRHGLDLSDDDRAAKIRAAHS